MRRAAALVVATLALLLAGSASALEPEGVKPEDRLDLIELDRRVLAVNGKGGGPVATTRLELGERVLALESQGLVGVVTTTSRLLGYSSRSPNPAELRYRVAERPRGPEQVRLGDRVALVIFRTRLAALAPTTGSWLELALAPGEQPERVFADANLAGITTGRRAIAFAPQSGGFVETGLSPRESIERIQISDNSVSLVTPRRLLIFRVGDEIWTEVHREDKRD